MSFIKNALGLPQAVFALAIAGVSAGAVAQQAAPETPHGVTRAARTSPVPVRNLDEMIEKARTDLALRLGGKPTEITLAGWKSVQLPARVLRCEAEKGDADEPSVAGYRIVLVYKARDYTYQSDTRTVTACPKIAAD